MSDLRGSPSHSTDADFPIPDDSLYVIYSIGNSAYQEWQADLLDFSFDRAGQRGTLIRIVSEDSSGSRDINPTRYGFTFVSPDFSRFGEYELPDWPVMNKPGSLKYFFDALPTAFKQRNANSDLVFLDPDMIFVKPWDPKGSFAAGEVHGQKWKNYSQSFCQASSIEPGYCPESENSENGPIMFPFSIKLGDMERVFDDIAHFARQGYIKNQAWMADMPAFVTAIEKHGLKNRQVDNIGLCNNWNNNNDADAPIMHYCQPIRNSNQEIVWSKTGYNPRYRCGDPFPPVPSPAQATNRVDREVLKMLDAKIRSQRFTSLDDGTASAGSSKARLPRVIWTAWLQGEQSQPPVVRDCIRSWVRRNPGWQLNVIDNSNIGDYLDLDLNGSYLSGLEERLQSDVLRLQLLARYGGVWTDSTSYCNKPLDGWIDQHMQSGFFSFDAEAEGRLMAGWFIAALPGNLLVETLSDRFARYLMTDKSDNLPYFIMQHHFTDIVTTNPECRDLWLDSSKVPPDECLRLYYFGYHNNVDDELKRFIDSNSAALHKLTYKLMLPDSAHGQASAGTSRGAVLEEFSGSSAIRYLLRNSDFN